jgi:hypothetical protein
MTFRELFGRSTQARLLDFLTDHVGSMYTWQEIIKHNPKITRATMNKLVKAKLIKAVNTGLNICYMINDENELVRAVIHSDFVKGKAAAEREAKANVGAATIKQYTEDRKKDTSMIKKRR